MPLRDSSPELLKGPNALKTPDDLRKHKLLYVYTAEEDWHLWLEEAGVAPERIALDPGIGFGKTTEHNLEVLRRLPELVALGYPVVIGVSRKRFIGEVTGEVRPDRRVAGSVAGAAYSALHGGDVIRVHDVAETVQALRMIAAIAGGLR